MFLQVWSNYFLKFFDLSRPAPPFFKVPVGDILIHCGDLTNRGSAPELQDVNAWLEEMETAKVETVGFRGQRAPLKSNELIPRMMGF